ncbi:DUF2612 domain-containing protein [Francisella marina]|uniref:DUF2612 domain-containing protein n=1 Tax=Francisella marina TaxID=2249302 RepID=A0ABX5ZGM7_9GAMM|nr:DUF2612 domain-containing protein [Francisella marina]QEO57549.1 DUF2612 domain-containing protein [Francisella marina]
MSNININEFKKQYTDLIILQYSDKPKALGEISLYSQKGAELYNLIKDFLNAYDLDIATGEQLDVIGRIVGINRTLENGTPVIYFGYTGYQNTGGYYSNVPYLYYGGRRYTSSQLTDDDFRFVIRCKIAKNFARAYLSDGEFKQGMQSLYSFVFKNECVVRDHKDMTFSLIVSDNVTQEQIRIMSELDLFIRPMGVKLRAVIQIPSTGAFGYQHYPLTLGYNLAPYARYLSL